MDTARKGTQLAYSLDTVGVCAKKGSGAAVPQQRSAPRQCVGVRAALPCRVLGRYLRVLTCAAAEHVRVCFLAVRAALPGQGGALEGRSRGTLGVHRGYS